MKSLLAASTLSLGLVGAAQANTYLIDPTHTFVNYEVSHFGTSTNRGRFDNKEGTVVFDRAAKTGKVGDGKIFVTEIERVVRIRTWEADEAAL